MTAVIVFGAYRFRPSLVQNLPQAQLIGVMALVGVVYYLTLHQLGKHKYPAVTTLVLTIIVVGDLVFAISQTGWLDSSYFGLWLLVIVLAGLYGVIYSSLLTILTFLSVFLAIGLQQNSFSSVWPQILTTLAAGALGWWLYIRTHQSPKVINQVQSLSGRLNQEIVKNQLLIRSIGNGVVVVGPDLKIQLFNAAAEQMTGWDEASAKGLDWKAVMKLSDAAETMIDDHNDPFKRAWQTSKSLNFNDLTLASKNGHKLPLYVTISPILNADKTIGGGIAVFRDTTEDRAAERQRSEFISTASHEMRTPVAAIEGYLALALSPKVATIDPRAREYLTKAHTATNHLGELFKDLLSITKIEDRQLISHAEKFDLVDLTRQVIGDMRLIADKKNLPLRFTAGNSQIDQKVVWPLYFVMADKERIREVLSNLVDNAIKFTPKGEVVINISGTDQLVTVTVADTGVGIPAQDIPHLFQKFYRVDNSTTRTIGGTGLGLYLARVIVELYGGKITVNSQAGKGSTFSFSLARIPSESLDKIKVEQTFHPNPTVAVGIAPK